jgi:hypothetical protein
LIGSLIPELRSKIKNKCYPSLCDGANEADIVNCGEFNPHTAQRGGKFQINRTAASLVIEHTALVLLHRAPWVDLPLIGNYVVTYSDNTTASIPVTYGGNVCYWNRRQNAPLEDPFYRHNGYLGTWECDGVESTLQNGDIATLYRYEWINPFPEKTISSVEYVEAEGAETFVAVNRISTIE